MPTILKPKFESGENNPNGAPRIVYEDDELIRVEPGPWVCEAIIVARYGFSRPQLAKNRANYWLNGIHFKRNPANTLVYNPTEIDRWQATNRN